MSTAHHFGGAWTHDKLERLRKYLQAYTTIFNKNKRAKLLHTIYVDAFAGTGYRNPKSDQTDTALLFEPDDVEHDTFLKGSARIALEVEPPFKEYIFIERDPDYAQELKRLEEEFRTRRGNINTITAEANTYLLEWVQRINWRTTRAVVFLDPYGMEVEWRVMEALGQTQAVDVWVLFPAGVAVNRLLTRSGPPPEPWSRALTRSFGTEEWRSAFYRRQTVQTLFDEEEVEQKEATVETIAQFFRDRLKTVFAGVAEPLLLRNSRNTPLYVLCFAAANPKGARTAIKIANHILRK